MIGGDYSLELNNIFHTGQVEPASCFQRLFGSVQTGLILKDITLEVRAGEVMAILGSKGGCALLITIVIISVYCILSVTGVVYSTGGGIGEERGTRKA